jgi:ribosomal protein S6--L-glutamate ligase
MRFASFDVFRTLGFPDTRYFKPDHLFRHQSELSAAEWILFPEYWQINALIYGMGCRVFPSQASYLLGHNKIEMTRAFQTVAPAHVPVTHIRANTPDNAEELWQEMTHPFVAKLAKSSMGEGVWLIEERDQWREYLGRTDTLYVQEWLPIDRDVRVVVVGDQVLAAYWRLQSGFSFHNNVARGGSVDYSPVPAVVTDLALSVARKLGVDHAGFDIALVGDHPYLLEFNRLFGNQGIPGGGQRLREAILGYLERQSAQNDDPSRPPEPVAA